MRAITLNYDTRALELADIAEPVLERDGDVLVRVEEGGVCGTDHELANFSFGYPPPGSGYLVLGHEAIGQVVQTGRAVRGLVPGDWVVPMVRRACTSMCVSCARHRRDLCVSADYTERGIFGAHGYLTRFAVDAEEDLIRVPSNVADVGVLIEPLSVVEKAVETALRLHTGGADTCAVLGAGTIGILAALVMRKRGLEVTIHSAEARESSRVRMLEAAGLRYATELHGRFDIILEATGSNEAASHALGFLAPLGVFLLLGAKQSAQPFPFIQLIVQNQIVTGSVNAGPEHALRAAEELGQLDRALLERMIYRVPLDRFEDSILGTLSDKPKIVHVME